MQYDRVGEFENELRQRDKCQPSAAANMEIGQDCQQERLSELRASTCKTACEGTMSLIGSISLITVTRDDYLPPP